MSSTIGAKVGAGAGCATGIVLLIGAIPHSAPLAATGACLILLSLTALILLYVRVWISDTNDERRRFDDASVALEAERCRYVACQAGVQAERTRVRAELAAGNAALEEKLRIQGEAMWQQYEDERAKLITDAFEMGARMAQDGHLEPATRGAQVIHLPSRDDGHPEAANHRP